MRLGGEACGPGETLEQRSEKFSRVVLAVGQEMCRSK